MMTTTNVDFIHLGSPELFVLLKNSPTSPILGENVFTSCHVIGKLACKIGLLKL